MKASQPILLNGFQPMLVEPERLDLLIIGGGEATLTQLQLLRKPRALNSITIVAPVLEQNIKQFASRYPNLTLLEREFDHDDLADKNFVIAATHDTLLNERIKAAATGRRILVHSVSSAFPNDFVFLKNLDGDLTGEKMKSTTLYSEKEWRKIATYLVVAFALMVTGHLIISALPIPAVQELISAMKPYFNYQFLFFIVAGFAAQMVDGALSMGYGVTSATCLMSFGVSPVSVSAAIHTSEIFTTGISGYSHYKFGNVNKKLFRHLVIPGVIGAIAGALMLVALGERAGKWLMPAIALYAMFLGLKILLKAFQLSKSNSKVKRIGWLAGAGGFFDSFGGGGWGPIVTSTLVSKGRDPKYTVGSVCLTEFFVTMASAITFFLTVGVSHWNIVLGLIIGGSIAAPFAAKLAGKLPRKTMMIAVGVIVIIWCIRMFVKSITSL